MSKGGASAEVAEQEPLVSNMQINLSLANATREEDKKTGGPESSGGRACAHSQILIGLLVWFLALGALCVGIAWTSTSTATETERGTHRERD